MLTRSKKEDESETSISQNSEMNLYLKLFNEREKTNDLLKKFNSSVSDAFAFIKNFENIKLAEDHLISSVKECNEKLDNSCGMNCKWIFDRKTKTLFIRGSGEMKGYGTVNKVPRTPWFSIREQIENVVISEGITTIGKCAFYYCSSLTTITIPNSVTTIRGHAFSYCSSLTSITIPESVTSIGRLGFCSCSKLASIHIPKNVKEIGQRAFAGCSNLSTITVDENNEYFKSVDNVLFTKDGTKLIRYAPTKTETSYIISDGVVVIADYAFDKCSHLESITIPKSITTIESFAFNECSSLKVINIPESVKIIGTATFQKCSSLTSISIPNNVETIKNKAFNNCSNLSTANVPKKFQERKDKIFTGCPKLKAINWIE